MGAVYFYHLTRSAPEAAVAMLAERSLGAGWRVAVRLRDSDRAAWLDERLWLGPEDGFLAHGLAGGPHDDLQPVLLGTGALPAGCACLMALDGAEVRAEEAAGLERVCILFDGNDPQAVEAARGQWRALTGAGVAAQYWSEESGRWQKKAEAGG
ncbi:MAG: DNA polymerase III subunit chi [Proteobacteria bacterium]|nr:DNA polymerase III subunit chi [Pseudomonadota bacterium]MBS0572411.1 DNA polymerase III subunit chi [Pseudomonadota bacterium]